MHETTIAQSLVEAIVQEAEKRRAKPIRAKMSCGELNAVNDEVLSFAFDAVAAGTPCAGVKLEVEHKALQAKCRRCERTFVVEMSDVRCPHCKGDDFELLPDAPLILEEIEFEEGTDDEQD
ncbi:MAG: hydrogenase maturation nickel metallochaperone HypA [Sedimentisphaerales bacterium]|nr:hydrogenase maturation nickel metallochaperone HypA [Sedimentisphaerales bacterium]